jgi:hypothetical protein
MTQLNTVLSLPTDTHFNVVSSHSNQCEAYVLKKITRGFGLDVSVSGCKTAEHLLLVCPEGYIFACYAHHHHWL